MKNPIKKILLVFLFSLALMSCRDEAETTEDKVDNMIENAEEVKIKEDKVKIENADGSETKIKYDENGNVEKIKTDD